MAYKIHLTEQARQDLREIYEYIAFALLEPEIARKVRKRITDKLYSLKETPEMYAVYQEEPWKSRGLRRINIENYSGFYLIEGKNVQVIRILYSGRDISNILSSE